MNIDEITISRIEQTQAYASRIGFPCGSMLMAVQSYKKPDGEYYSEIEARQILTELGVNVDEDIENCKTNYEALENEWAKYPKVRKCVNCDHSELWHNLHGTTKCQCKDCVCVDFKLERHSEIERLKACRTSKIISFFFKHTWDQVVALSVDGVVGPHAEKEEELLLSGKKPVWFCTLSEGKKFVEEHSEFILNEIPVIKSIPNKSNEVEYLSCGVFKDSYENHEAYKDLVKAWDMYKSKYGGEIEISHDIAVGKAIGYTNNDIAKYITHNFNQQQFNDWKKEINHVDV